MQGRLPIALMLSISSTSATSSLVGMTYCKRRIACSHHVDEQLVFKAEEVPVLLHLNQGRVPVTKVLCEFVNRRALQCHMTRSWHNPEA